MISARMTSLALLVARVPIGLYFLIAGYNKIAGTGVGAFVEKAATNLPTWAEAFGRAYLYTLPFLECLAGLLVLLGLLTRTGALLMALMLVSFLIAVREPAYIHNIVGAKPGIPFDRNWLLLSGTLALALLGGGPFAIDALIRRRRARAVGQAVAQSH